MRQMILKLAAAIAVITTAGAAPAMACGSPCGQGFGTSYGYAGVASYERLPDPAHQYYYVNQGPTFSGPGNFAPYPTYQETAVRGWTGYERGDGDYDGGPYANATNHYSYAQPYARGPVQYSYQPRRANYRYGYSMRHQVRYGYATRSHAPRYGYAARSYAPRHGYTHRRFAGPRVMYAPRHGMMHAHRHGMHHGRHHQAPLRRYY
eukprot:gene33595-44993_t